MKKVISALLCLFLVSCNSAPVATSPTQQSEKITEAPTTIVSDAPAITISYSELNNYTFFIETDEDSFRVSGDNMQGKKSQLHVAMTGYDAILELNTKGGCKMYTRTSEDEDYVESEIEYTDFNEDSLREILCQVGVDFSDYYTDAKFSLQDESDDSYIYRMDYKNDTYDLTVDKETGIWTKLSCEGKLLMRVTNFSLKKGIIPNH